MNRSSIKCSAPGCTNVWIPGEKKSFFRFPKEPSRCYKWLKFCGLEDRFATALDVKHSTRICVDHFDKALYYTGRRTRLISTALPTIQNNERSVPRSPSIVMEQIEEDFEKYDNSEIKFYNDEVDMKDEMKMELQQMTTKQFKEEPEEFEEYETKFCIAEQNEIDIKDTSWFKLVVKMESQVDNTEEILDDSQKKSQDDNKNTDEDETVGKLFK